MGVGDRIVRTRVFACDFALAFWRFGGKTPLKISEGGTHGLNKIYIYTSLSVGPVGFGN